MRFTSKKFNFKDAAVKVGGLGAGVVVGDLIINKIAPKISPDSKRTYKGIGTVVLGMLAAPLIGSKGHGFGTALIDGVIARGTLEIMRGADVIPAINGSDDDVLGDVGYNDSEYSGDYEEDSAMDGVGSDDDVLGGV
jgi:hypothetical protein